MTKVKVFVYGQRFSKELCFGELKIMRHQQKQSVTDGQADTQKSDPNAALCFTAATKIQSHHCHIIFMFNFISNVKQVVHIHICFVTLHILTD